MDLEKINGENAVMLTTRVRIRRVSTQMLRFLVYKVVLDTRLISRNTGKSVNDELTGKY